MGVSASSWALSSRFHQHTSPRSGTLSLGHGDGGSGVVGQQVQPPPPAGRSQGSPALPTEKIHQTGPCGGCPHAAGLGGDPRSGCNFHGPPPQCRGACTGDAVSVIMEVAGCA